MSSFRALAVALALIALTSQKSEAQTPPADAQIVGRGSGLCVEAPNASTASAQELAQGRCAGQAHQQWNFQSVSGGYRIVNRNSGLCMDVPGSSANNGAIIIQYACHANANQRFSLRASGGGSQIVSASSGKCLAVVGASVNGGAKIEQRTCATTASQQWAISAVTTPPTPNPTAALSGLMVNRRSGMCAEAPGASKSTGVQMDQKDCGEAAHMLWDFRPVTDGYQIVNRNSGLCLDVNGALAADGATAIQWTCASQPNQRWTLRATGEIVAAHSGKCLTVTGASIDGGAKLVQSTCLSQDNQRWTVSTAGPVSTWSKKYPLSLVPVAAATLRNGKVLAWSAYDRFNFGGDEGKTYSTIFDPATGGATEKLVSNTSHDMFCPGTATLADGRILVNGGSSSAKTSIYNPDTNTWTSGPAMNVPRGYQGDTTLSTGEVLTVGGSWSGGTGGKIGEVWSSGGAWRKLTKVTTPSLEANPDPQGVYRSDNHMWLYGVSGGYAFHAGPSKNMNWISTASDGAITSAGTRGDDAHAMNGNVVMYDAGKLLKMGGAVAYQDALASSAAYTIDFSGGPTKAVTVAKQQPMAFPRAFANAVVLPNGEVVVVGGQTYPVPFSDDRSILFPEIWSPATGAFRRLAWNATPRTYHSVATLLRDGRVLVGGGGLCGTCKTNHADVEILTPPYLLNADGTARSRPVITGAPTAAGAAEQIEVSTDRAVSSFAIVRMSAVTHSVNNDQRRLVLPVASANASTYRMTLPTDAGLLIKGDWMLFAMDASGTPSVANILRVR